MAKINRNCHSCALATDDGHIFTCKFNHRKILEELPFYPVIAITVHPSPIRKDKVPNKDCPAYKEPKKART